LAPFPTRRPSDLIAQADERAHGVVAVAEVVLGAHRPRLRGGGADLAGVGGVHAVVELAHRAPALDGHVVVEVVAQAGGRGRRAVEFELSLVDGAVAGGFGVGEAAHDRPVLAAVLGPGRRGESAGEGGGDREAGQAFPVAKRLHGVLLIVVGSPRGVGQRHAIGARMNRRPGADWPPWNRKRVPRRLRGLADRPVSLPADAAVARLSEARHNTRSPHARGPSMADLKEARVPDIGGYDDVPVIEVLVAVGDTVAKDQGLVTLESDKATMEVPAPFGGVVREVKVSVGDAVSEGSVVAMIEAGADAAAADEAGDKAGAAAGDGGRAQPEAPAEKTRAPEPATATPATRMPEQPDKLAEHSMEDHGGQAAPRQEARGPAKPPVRFEAAAVDPGKVPYARPAVRLFARELGVDLSQVTGSERGGRISKEDVRQ